jgi:hypothetical protein
MGHAEWTLLQQGPLQAKQATHPDSAKHADKWQKIGTCNECSE